MSSDSEESHSSAHNDHGDDIDAREGVVGTFDAQEDDSGESATEQRSLDEDDSEDVQSVDNGIEGLTFARTRRRSPQEETHDSASVLSIRPTIEVAGSPASTDIPDDTPSVQVCSLADPHGNPLTKTGFRNILTHEQRARVAQLASPSPTDIAAAIRTPLLVPPISIAWTNAARPVTCLPIAALATVLRIEQSRLPTTV